MGSESNKERTSSEQDLGGDFGFRAKRSTRSASRLTSLPTNSPPLPLLTPAQRQVLTQLLKAQAVGFIATQDRLDDVGGAAGQAEHAPDVGPVDADGLGQVFEAWVLARFELLLPAVGLGDGLDECPVGPIGVRVALSWTTYPLMMSGLPEATLGAILRDNALRYFASESRREFLK